MPIVHSLRDLSAVPASPIHIPVFERLLESKAPHEDDFLFFANFAGRDGLFFDIGANIANSVLSIHLVQPRWEIVSFEPNVSLRYFLERARQHLAAHGARMEFHQIGLSDHDDTLDFYIPKIDDWYVVGEASFDLPHFDNPIVRDRLSSYSTHGYWELARTVVPVRRFDDLTDIRAKIASCPAGSELVVKMDVEGYEATALRGMLDLIRQQRAIFMVEYSGDPAVDDIFVSHGYEVFDYSVAENRLWRNAGKRGLNSFYVPKNRLEADDVLRSVVTERR